MDDFTIGDLEVATDVPRRTIYFYVQQGILPPPSGAGLAARYHRSHLIRLRAIPRLRSLGWRLDRIREFFERGADEDVAAVVEGREPMDLEAAANTSPVAESPMRFSPGAPALIARYSLAPGVDLFVQRDVAPSVAADVERLLESAARIFDRSANRSNGGANRSGERPTDVGVQRPNAANDDHENSSD